MKSFPIFEQGSVIKTELTKHALELHMPVDHVEGSYNERLEGSNSKLNTYRDGFRILILILILKLFKHERPCTDIFVTFFSFSISSIKRLFINWICSTLSFFNRVCKFYSD